MMKILILRCFWMSTTIWVRCTLKQLFSSSTITLVTTILSKGHSLGHPLVNALLLAVTGAGPRPLPRRSCSSRNKFKQLFSASPITYVTTTLSKYHSLGQPLGKCPTPGCQRCWTSPRWSWISGNNAKLLFPSSPITFVTTKSPKFHSL